MNLPFISILLLFNILGYSLAQVPGRFCPSCGYLSQKIYCFGGSTGSDADPVLDSNLMYLDIVKNSGNSTKELETKWTTIVSNTNGVDLEPRSDSQSMVLPDGKTMLLSGGWNSADSSLASQTIAYNVDNNSWSQYPSYTEPPFGVRQIYYASSVYIPDYGVGFYGGFETNINQSWTYKDHNVTHYLSNNNKVRFIGYTSLTFFDIRKSTDPWFVFPTQNNLPQVFSSEQTSVFDTLSNRIFFFGGRYRDPSVRKYVPHSFEKSLTFNVISGIWDSQVLSGSPPTGRTIHTTTLLRSTNRDVLLYGGENFYKNANPCLDYLYTLNLDSYKWEQQTIANSEGLDLIRSRHSAVPVSNNTMFIVFGINVSGVPISSMIILNVTDPSNISYVSAYVDHNGGNAHVDPTGAAQNSTSNSSGLSTGATTGIAVGAVIGGLIIITGLFCVWKKNKDKKKREELELEKMKRENERIEAPVMEVNWEEIDGNFATNPTTNFSLHPRLNGNEATLAYIKPETNTQMVKPQGLNSQYTDSIENNAMNTVLPASRASQKPEPDIKMVKPQGLNSQYTDSIENNAMNTLLSASRASQKPEPDIKMVKPQGLNSQYTNSIENNAMNTLLSPSRVSQKPDSTR